MARKYELKRRAERQEETHRRIVEAAVELHRTKGPARTTVSDIARVAGVQRHTFYRHFRDERQLSLACSGHYLDSSPPPDPESWARVPAPDDRLRRALAELYAYYEAGDGMLVSVSRDAEVHELTREVLELRFGPFARRAHELLAEGRPDRPRLHAAIDLALDIRTWQRLTRSGLSTGDAAELMVAAVRCQ